MGGGRDDGRSSPPESDFRLPVRGELLPLAWMAVMLFCAVTAPWAVAPDVIHSQGVMAGIVYLLVLEAVAVGTVFGCWCALSLSWQGHPAAARRRGSVS